MADPPLQSDTQPPESRRHSDPMSLSSVALALLLATDSIMKRLNILLSTSDGLERVLATIGHSSHALHHVLASKPSSALQGRLRVLLRQILLRQGKSSPSETLADSPSTPLLALSSLVSETRFTLRLLGLVSAWAWGSDTVRSPPKDRVLRAIAFLQVFTYALYQSLENLAYLASKGIAGKRLVDRWGGVGAWYLWSTRAWLGHVVLDFIKLGREHALRLSMTKAQQARSAMTNTVADEMTTMLDSAKEDEEEARRLEVRRWRKSLVNNLIWAPLYVHWSLEDGIGVPDSLTGLIGLIAGAWGLHDSWRATAKC